eukprot:Unigene11652_Nuclearia_a/m.35497 Unigene11652_Nuclearia_a/g.35497  ORF Unigene11652_Nuclearia_a/g.35497 Unigene11652_Nuclearia_a/m.35497 type:complete len:320 (-) Unigene11652_Nuclearia_a:10-969(-)
MRMSVAFLTLGVSRSTIVCPPCTCTMPRMFFSRSAHSDVGDVARSVRAISRCVVRMMYPPLLTNACGGSVSLLGTPAGVVATPPDVPRVSAFSSAAIWSSPRFLPGVSVLVGGDGGGGGGVKRKCLRYVSRANLARSTRRIANAPNASDASNGRTRLSLAMWRGRRWRVIAVRSSNRVAVLRMPWATCVAPSNTPTTGLVTAPISPDPMPLTKPIGPDARAPSAGLLKMPVNPLEKPLYTVDAPVATPSIAFCGAARSRRSSWKRASNVASARPLPTESVIRDTPSNSPITLFFSSDAVPRPSPLANSSGDRTRPWYGS